jgi:hypothetical protein
VSDDADQADNPYASPPPASAAPPPPPYGTQPDWGPPPLPPPPQYPPYGAPPGWQPPPPVPPPYGQPPGYGAPQGWGGGYQQYAGYAPSAGTNGFAVASLICSVLLSWLLGLGGILGLVFGIIGIRQCARSGQGGRGLAIAGIVISAVVIAFWILVLIVGIATHGTSNDNDNFGALGPHSAQVLVSAARSSA